MAQVTVKLVLLVPLPPGVTTVMWPVVAPFGTVAVICAYEFHFELRETPIELDRGGAGERRPGDGDDGPRGSRLRGEAGHGGPDHEVGRAPSGPDRGRHRDRAREGTKWHLRGDLRVRDEREGRSHAI